MPPCVSSRFPNNYLRIRQLFCVCLCGCMSALHCHLGPCLLRPSYAGVKYSMNQNSATLTISYLCNPLFVVVSGSPRPLPQKMVSGLLPIAMSDNVNQLLLVSDSIEYRNSRAPPCILLNKLRCMRSTFQLVGQFELGAGRCNTGLLRMSHLCERNEILYCNVGMLPSSGPLGPRSFQESLHPEPV